MAAGDNVGTLLTTCTLNAASLGTPISGSVQETDESVEVFVDGAKGAAYDSVTRGRVTATITFIDGTRPAIGASGSLVINEKTTGGTRAHTITAMKVTDCRYDTGAPGAYTVSMKHVGALATSPWTTA